MSAPIYLKIIKQYRRQVEAKNTKAVADLVAGWRKIAEAVVPEMVALAEKVYKRRDDFSEAELYRMGQYQRLLAQVNRILRQYNEQYTIPLTDRQQAIFAYLGLEHGQGLALAANPGQAIALTLGRTSEEAIQNLIALSRAGQPLANLLKAAYPKAAAGLTQQLLLGLAKSLNPRQTARLMMNEGIAMGLNHILLVARDQQIRAYRTANQYTFAQLGVEQYRRVAAHNSRTCAACLALDGELFETNVLMPLHPQDRCALLPVIGRFKGKPPKNGEAWFRSQPNSVQKHILGPGRWAAWQEGRFEFRQLVSVRKNDLWGPSARVTSLRRLLAGRGGLDRGKLPRVGW